MTGTSNGSVDNFDAELAESRGNSGSFHPTRLP